MKLVGVNAARSSLASRDNPQTQQSPPFDRASVSSSCRNRGDERAWRGTWCTGFSFASPVRRRWCADLGADWTSLGELWGAVKYILGRVAIPSKSTDLVDSRNGLSRTKPALIRLQGAEYSLPCRPPLRTLLYHKIVCSSRTMW